MYKEHHDCGHDHVLPEPEAIDLKPWQKVFEQIMRDTYEGKIKPGQLSDKHVRQTYEELNKATGTGYGKKWNKVNDGGKGKELNESSLPDPKVEKMQRNLYKFSMAKDFAMLEELNSKMYKDGKLVGWEEFKNEALKLNDKYNLNYLQAEYQTARQSGHMAQIWEAIQDNKELFPNLKYKTQGDERVRDKHKSLEGTIAPVDSEFWNKYYPPNGWRCRCYVVQTAESVSTNIPEKPEGVAPEFQSNIGKGGQIFKEAGKAAHKFFALAKEQGGQQLKDTFEMSKLKAPLNTVYKSPKGATVEVSIFADDGDKPGNIAATKAIAKDLNISSQVIAHVNVEGFKNPEIKIADTRGDRVAPVSKNIRRATSNIFDDKLGKDGQLRDEEQTFIIIDIWFDVNNKNVNDFASQSWSKVSHYKKLTRLFLHNNGKASVIERIDMDKDYATYADAIAKALK